MSADESKIESLPETHIVKAELRKETGKNACRRLLLRGLLPANLLGKRSSTNIQLDPKFLSVIWKSGGTFRLDLEGKVFPVKMHELQVNPVKRTPLHVDLMPL
ncbi:MAG: hypothetical protein KA436_03345 [Oligoflexales bacterium]|nr:hypothetical protein [Oligoflexales bacterium]